MSGNQEKEELFPETKAEWEKLKADVRGLRDGLPVFDGTCPACGEVATFNRAALTSFKLLGLKGFALMAFDKKGFIGDYVRSAFSTKRGDFGHCQLCKAVVVKCPGCNGLTAERSVTPTCSQCCTEFFL